MGPEIESQKEKISDKAVLTFLVMVISLTAVVEWIYCNVHDDIWVALLMWIPAISAFAATFVSIRTNNERFSFAKQRDLLNIKKCKFKYIIAGVLIPIVYLIIPYTIYWITHEKSLDLGNMSITYLLIYSLIALPVSLLTATGEEIGWRGFMFPALSERIGVTKSVTAVSFFWCFWHIPIIIWGGYMEGTPIWYRISAFVVCIFPVGIITALLTMKSSSMWPAAFLHASHNAFDQAIFGGITVGDDKMYYVSETGLITIICVWVVAVLMCIHHFRRLNED